MVAVHLVSHHIQGIGGLGWLVHTVNEEKISCLQVGQCKNPYIGDGEKVPLRTMVPAKYVGNIDTPGE